MKRIRLRRMLFAPFCRKLSFPGPSTTTSRCSARCVVFDIVPVVTGMVPIPTLVAGMSFSFDCSHSVDCRCPAEVILRQASSRLPITLSRDPVYMDIVAWLVLVMFSLQPQFLLFIHFYFTYFFIISPSWPPSGIFVCTFSPQEITLIIHSWSPKLCSEMIPHLSLIH